jgi:hypothetical protein
MQTLLIVLIAGCALVAAVHMGRGIWARSRSVQRHQQALDTLASFTAPVDGAPRAHGEGGDHQAHVRVIGRSGHIPGGAAGPGGPGATLPPSRELRLPGPARTLPFRRPSHLEPSAAAMDAVATSARLSPRSPARLVPSGPPDEATIPGMPPLRLEGPPTRPVPIIQPQVFYFDDVPPGTVAKHRGHAPDDAANDAGAGPKTAAPRRKLSVARPVAVAAVSVAVAGVALGVEIANPSHRGGVASPSTPPSHRAAPPARPTTTGAPATTTPAPATSVTTAPPRPAVLLSANGGTATYQLTSRAASIVVRATGPCWIEVKAGGHAGQVVYEGTLGAGQDSKVTGPAWIRLGDPPDVAVSVDGTLMTVPGAATAVPLDLQFTLG